MRKGNIMEVTEKIKEIVKKICPEDRYLIFRYLRWFHIQKDVRQMVEEKGWYCDGETLTKAVDYHVYQGGWDPAKTYRNNLETAWKYVVDQKGQMVSYGDQEQIRWLHATDEGCLLNVLKNFSNAAISRDGKTLLDPEEREVLYAILLEPMVYEDMRGYLVQKRRKADRSLLAKASCYYAYEMEKDWDQTYWDSLWTAIIDTQKTRQPAEMFGKSYELLVIPQSNATAIHVPCKIYSEDLDFSLINAIKEAAKEYAAEHPGAVDVSSFSITDFLTVVPRRVCMDHGFTAESIERITAVHALAPTERLLEEGLERRIPRQDAYDEIIKYVYGQMNEADTDDNERWKAIDRIRKSVDQCDFDAQDTIAISSLLTAVEDYRKTHFPTEWLHFAYKR